jgi:hypothetical protein
MDPTHQDPNAGEERETAIPKKHRSNDKRLRGRSKLRRRSRLQGKSVDDRNEDGRYVDDRNEDDPGEFDLGRGFRFWP